MKKIFKEILPYLVILLVVILIRTFIITPVAVEGESMLPNLHNNQVLLLSKITYKVTNIKRFDVVVIDLGDNLLIKRVIGLPGDYIEYKDDLLYVNGNVVKEDFNKMKTNDFKLEDICNCTKIPKDKYLVLGDNRTISKDSRSIGLINIKEIKGKTVLRIWPLNKISSVK